MGAATTDLWRMSATDVAEAIRSRQTSSREVIEAHLRRIEEVNPSINAVAVVLGERAVEAAKAADRAAAAGAKLPPLRGYAKRWVSALFEAAGDTDPATATRAFAVRQALLRAWGEFQQGHPLIVAPICTEIPFEVGKDRSPAEVAQTVRGMRMAMAVNALGLPAVAVPVGVRDGLPQVVQVIGPRHREDLCLDAAAALEDRVDIIAPIDPG
jgi:Asp-tRNA(Asn)/Glu-tRNA(Gln) amidotransferase A subunit family amidase